MRAARSGGLILLLLLGSCATLGEHIRPDLDPAPFDNGFEWQVADQCKTQPELDWCR